MSRDDAKSTGKSPVTVVGKSERFSWLRNHYIFLIIVLVLLIIFTIITRSFIVASRNKNTLTSKIMLQTSLNNALYSLNDQSIVSVSTQLINDNKSGEITLNN